MLPKKLSLNCFQKLADLVTLLIIANLPYSGALDLGPVYQELKFLELVYTIFISQRQGNSSSKKKMAFSPLGQGIALKLVLVQFLMVMGLGTRELPDLSVICTPLKDLYNLLPGIFGITCLMILNLLSHLKFLKEPIKSTSLVELLDQPIILMS